jgi:hypothetical protein
MKKFLIGLGIMCFIMIIALLFLFTSCQKTVYTPVQPVQPVQQQPHIIYQQQPVYQQPQQQPVQNKTTIIHNNKIIYVTAQPNNAPTVNPTTKSRVILVPKVTVKPSVKPIVKVSFKPLIKPQIKVNTIKPIKKVSITKKKV